MLCISLYDYQALIMCSGVACCKSMPLRWKHFVHNICDTHANHDCGCIITIAHFESKSDEMSERKAPDLGHWLHAFCALHTQVYNVAMIK